MLCPVCSNEVKETAKFCGKCGAKLPRCPSCGRLLTKRTNFCFYDGTPIPEEIRSLLPEEPESAPVVIPVVPVPDAEPVPEEEPEREEIIPPLPPVIPEEPEIIPEEPKVIEEPAPQKPGKKKKKPMKVILILMLALLMGTAAGAVGFWAWRNLPGDPDPGVETTAPALSDAEEETQASEEQSTAPTETVPAPTVLPTESAPEPTTLPTEPVAPETEPPAPVYVSEYEVIAADLSWQEAKLACESRGGTLASITSREEYDKICAYADASGLTYLWLGAGLNSETEEWHEIRWLTGESWTFDNWYPGEPSKADMDGTPEHCLCIWKAKYQGQELGWTFNDQRNDIVGDFPNVSGKIGYICEYRIEVTP